MIKYCESLNRALAVKLMVDELYNAKNKCEIWIESFDNCREQGIVYKIKDFTAKDILNIAVCRDRNSDSTKVFVYKETIYPSNLMKGGYYEYFNNMEDAAAFIVDTIEDYV